MVTVFYVIAILFTVLGVFLILGLTPVQITQDMMELIRPSNKLRNQAEDVRARRVRGGIYGELQRIRNTMEVTGRGKMFPLVLTSVVGFAALGVIISIALGNIWVMPSLVIALGYIPFIYMGSAVEHYEKSVRAELETALSIITNAYIRNNDIVKAVQEVLPFIKPPLRSVFERFVQDSIITSSKKEIIIRLRSRLDDQVFYEWCTTLLQCQDDRTLKENLTPVVNKLTDIRLINTEVSALIASAKTEYYTMLAFSLAIVPFLSVIMPGSLDVLLYTTIGKILTGVISGIVLFTYFRMRKITRPVNFNAK